MAKTWIIAGDVDFEAERYDSAIVKFSKAQAIYAQFQDDAGYVKMFTHLARVYEAAYDEPRREKMIAAALREAQNRLPGNHPVRGIALMLRGERFVSYGQPDSARHYLEAALTRLRNSPYHEEWTWNHCDLAIHFLQSSDFQTSQAHLLSARQVAEQMPADHAAHAIICEILGRIHSQQGNYESALTEAHRALELNSAHPPTNRTDSMDFARAHNGLGVLYFLKGDFARSIEFFHKSLAVHQHHPKTNMLDMGLCMNNIATAYRKAGQDAKSLSALRAAEHYMSQPTDFIEYQQLYLAKVNIAAHFIRAGDTAQARPYLEAAFKIGAEWDMRLQVALHYRGRLAMLEGKFAAARQAFRAALRLIPSDQSSPKAGTEYLYLARAFRAEAAHDSAMYALEQAIFHFGGLPEEVTQNAGNGVLRGIA
ncbi:MAG: tetratricopeptide repeat protein, partial [Bacteroidota bacterium]